MLLEFKEYATEVDVDFVRRSVRAIGRCAISLERAAERCINVLLELIQTKVNYVVQEAIIVIKDIFRRYPNRSADRQLPQAFARKVTRHVIQCISKAAGMELLSLHKLPLAHRNVIVLLPLCSSAYKPRQTAIRHRRHVAASWRHCSTSFGPVTELLGAAGMRASLPLYARTWTLWMSLRPRPA